MKTRQLSHTALRTAFLASLLAVVLLFGAQPNAAMNKNTVINLVEVQVLNAVGELQAQLTVRDDHMASIYFDADPGAGLGLKPVVSAAQSVRLLVFKVSRKGDEEIVGSQLSDYPAVVPGHGQTLHFDNPVSGKLDFKVTGIRTVVASEI